MSMYWGPTPKLTPPESHGRGTRRNKAGERGEDGSESSTDGDATRGIGKENR
jgi:hypothetical protein